MYSRVEKTSVKQKMHVNSQNRVSFDNRPKAFALVKVKLGLNRNLLLSPIQYVRPGGKQQAGMPAKSKPGTKEKQQSKAQRAFNAFQKYRSDFFADNKVTVAHVQQYLAIGNKLHGHGSSSGSKDSGENQATKDDAAAFVGWWRKRYGKKG